MVSSILHLENLLKTKSWYIIPRGEIAGRFDVALGFRSRFACSVCLRDFPAIVFECLASVFQTFLEIWEEENMRATYLNVLTAYHISPLSFEYRYMKGFAPYIISHSLRGGQYLVVVGPAYVAVKKG